MSHSNGNFGHKKTYNFGFLSKWRPELLPITVSVQIRVLHRRFGRSSPKSQKFLGDTFLRNLGSKLKNLKIILKSYKNFLFAIFFKYFAAVVAVYQCAKIKLILISNKLSRRMRVFGLSFFRPHFSTTLRAVMFKGSYLRR